jgi:cell division protein ZapA
VPEIAITINGRNYRVTCGDGEEQRLHALAREFDERVQRLVRSVGQAGEAQLLVVTALMLADEFDEARTELAQLRAVPPPAPPVDTGAEARAAALIDGLSRRIEAIAEELERA